MRSSRLPIARRRVRSHSCGQPGEAEALLRFKVRVGESRQPRALEELRSARDAELLNSEFRAVLIRAAALHRSDGAFDWLPEAPRGGSRLRFLAILL